jgi:F-type H+-transporting ATPase subunit gamma
MPTLKELRIRVQSLKNTRKITSAMKMVSASKLKKAKDAEAKTRPYIEKINEVLGRLSGSLDNLDNPLLEVRNVKRTRYVLFSSDRGLCAGFNNNLFKFFIRECSSTETPFDVSTVGKKINASISKQELDMVQYYQDAASNPTFLNAQAISHDLISDFTSGKVDRVVLVYNKFISTLTQKPTMLQLLPFAVSIPENEEVAQQVDYLFEPGREDILNELLPKQISIQIYKSLLDNAVGEHAARMAAMDGATNNADDLISTLTIKLNRARQAAITTELTEIVSGAEAL